MNNNKTKQAAASLIKPYLKKFILQIHPDFFHHDHIKKQHNAQKLQELYTILNPILHSTKPLSTTQPKISTPISISFYKKQQQEQFLQKTAIKKKKEKKGKDDSTNTNEMISFSFSDTQQVWPTIQHFLSLCQQANIMILQSDQEAVQSMVQQQYKKPTTTRPPLTLREEFKKALYHDEEIKNRKNINNDNIQWTKERVLNEKLCMYDPNIKDLNHFANQLIKWLPHLQPEKWWGKIPTLFLSSSMKKDPDLIKQKDILILYEDMDLDDIQRSIQHYFSS
ncbi:hypothetical protein BJ944DRAFT_291627 [Cunninghamella echinulata]|nr:hypothetical protein BJ944DRAFT_291627 [Cunninghamella echinulata]